MSKIPYQKTVLPNGLRIITVPMDNPTVTVLVLVETGSKYETKNESGISHFLEHMCFKGTAKRPTAFDVTKELDGIGSSYNAFTGHEYTGYYAKAEARHFEKILDVVSDIYLNPKLEETEIQKEKGVIADEINMYEDKPDRKAAEYFMRLLYGDQPAGWDIAGTKDIIRSFGRDNFVRYRGEHYLPQSTIVLVSGGVPHEKAVASVTKSFAEMPTGEKHVKLPTKEDQEKPATFVFNKKTDQTHVVVGFRSHNLYHPDRYILSIMANILGGGMSSRLFQKIRDEMGVGYYVRAENDPMTDHGMFTVSTGVDNARAEEVIRAILLEFKKLRDEEVSEEELMKVKDYISGKLVLGLESSDSLAMFYGMQEVLREPLETPEFLTEKLREVTSDDIMRVAKDIFKNNRLNLALVGPFSDEKQFLDILSV